MSLNVLAISGSLREKSYNTALLHEAVRLAPAGMTIEIASIRDIPLYDADVEARGMPRAVTALSAKVKDADALLIATPEYNFSFPGVLKNVMTGSRVRRSMLCWCASRSPSWARAAGSVRRARSITCGRCARASACSRCRGRKSLLLAPGSSSIRMPG